jgi:hypothetical protein
MVGFIIYAGIAIAVLIMMQIVSRKWTQTWVGPGGRVLTAPEPVSSVFEDEVAEAI